MTHRVICSWCQAIIKPGGDPPTHGICPACFDEAVRPLRAELTQAIGPSQQAWISTREPDGQEVGT